MFLSYVSRQKHCTTKVTLSFEADTKTRMETITDMRDMIHDMCFSLVDINGVLSEG